MRELKAESQVFPIVQPIAIESGVKKPRTSRPAKEMAEVSNLTEVVIHEARSSGVAKVPAPASGAADRELPIDAIAETGSKRRQRQTTQKSKPASKAKKAVTPAKSGWEISKQLVLDRFRQLERECNQIKSQAEELNQQSTAIQAEMEHLRSIANQVTSKSLTGQDDSSRAAALIHHKSAVPKKAVDDQSTVQRHQVPEPIATARSDRPLMQSPSSPIPNKLLAVAHSAYEQQARTAEADRSSSQKRVGGSPRDRASQSLRTKRYTPTFYRGGRVVQIAIQQMQAWFQQMPQARGTIAIDALGLVFASAAIRMGLKFLVGAFPILSIGVSLLILLPAAYAIYLALFKPKANPVIIYRLLLITLGLWIGGKV